MATSYSRFADLLAAQQQDELMKQYMYASSPPQSSHCHTSLTSSSLGSTYGGTASWNDWNDVNYSYVPLQAASQSVWETAKKKFRFWRLNKVVEMYDGAELEDPLDELRLKIARWLNPGELYDFAK